MSLLLYVCISVLEKSVINLKENQRKYRNRNPLGCGQSTHFLSSGSMETMLNKEKKKERCVVKLGSCVRKYFETVTYMMMLKTSHI